MQNYDDITPSQTAARVGGLIRAGQKLTVPHPAVTFTNHLKLQLLIGFCTILLRGTARFGDFSL
jgi:hypothetical protein